jgi:hypothetical protein
MVETFRALHAQRRLGYDGESLPNERTRRRTRPLTTSLGMHIICINCIVPEVLLHSLTSQEARSKVGLVRR